MIGVLSAILLLNAASALRPATRVTSSTRLSAGIFPENTSGIYGDLAPTGFFDPAGLSRGKTADQIALFREAEIKHGRVCMLACVGVLTQEIFQFDFIGYDLKDAGIHHFDNVDAKFPEFGELFILLCAFIEGNTIKRNYGARRTDREGLLKEGQAPGDLGFDPLGWFPSDPAEQEIIKTKELQNGRLAMLGFLGIVAQELTDDHTVLCHFQKVCV